MGALHWSSGDMVQSFHPRTPRPVPETTNPSRAQACPESERAGGRLRERCRAADEKKKGGRRDGGLQNRCRGTAEGGTHLETPVLAAAKSLLVKGIFCGHTGLGFVIPYYRSGSTAGMGRGWWPIVLSPPARWRLTRKVDGTLLCPANTVNAYTGRR